MTTDKRIRKWLGHNGYECRVKIKRDGTVWRYGACDPFDRSKDFWGYMGTRDEICDEIAQIDALQGSDY